MGLSLLSYFLLNEEAEKEFRNRSGAVRSILYNLSARDEGCAAVRDHRVLTEETKI